MQTNLTSRFANFLKQFKPFNYLSFDQLNEISNSLEIINLEKDKSLFQINDQLHNCFYIVFSGNLHLTVIVDSQETLLNKCYEGDIFGLRPFFAKNNYQMNAKAREESVLLAIPINTFKPYLAQNENILNFLLESFASNTKNALNKENTNKIISENTFFTETPSDNSFLQTLNFNTNPLKVTKETSIRDVAQLMTQNRIGNAIIVENNFPIGIVTDSDFRSKIATGKFEIWSKIENIMISPVLTVSESVSIAEAQLVIIKNNLSHLCVTVDGTEKSEIKGIISEHDLVEAQANNPAVMLKEIKKTQSPEELSKIRQNILEVVQTSFAKNIPTQHICTIAGEITLAIIRRAAEIAILEMGSPPTNFALLSIGSQGRKEQLINSDFDSILIFDDVSPEKYKEVKDYFLSLSKKVSNCLENAGYLICENGHYASNTIWCKPLIDWTKQYTNWINTPGENAKTMATIFFDYEIAFGVQEIEDKLTDLIFKNSKNNTLFFDYLGNEALKNPTPLSFFKKFNIEEEGLNKGKFDIKNKAIQPLVDAARLLVLSQNIKGINNTHARFKQLAIADKLNAEIYLNCAEAFLILVKFRALEGIKNDSDGQFIAIDELPKKEKEVLKNALNPFKDLEDLIKDKFKLTQFS